MKTTKIICWAQTANDARHTASTTIDFELTGKRSAVSIAKELDEFGESAAVELIASGDIVAKSNRNGSRVATGHGVTIAYATGKLRSVRFSR